MKAVLKAVLIVIIQNLFIPHVYPLHTHAIICVPVADLVGQPMRQIYGKSCNTKNRYAQLPECGQGSLTTACQPCPRLHQLLLHEPVEILEENGLEVRIKAQNIFYIHGETATTTQTFWTLKSNVLPVTTIKHQNPLSIKQRYVTIQTPTYIKELGITLSVGTRCPLASHQNLDQQYNIFVLNKITKRFETVSIDQAYCTKHTPTAIDEKIKLFISILQQWSQNKDGIIPYVLGGCSIITKCSEYDFILDSLYLQNGKVNQVYRYPENINPIKTGLDCSGLITLAARLANIPYYCKNSITAAKTLSFLKANEPIEAGDLLWFPGHIIILSDIHAHKIIEARGYEHGYGKVHEIPLSEEFLNINTIEDLLYAYHTRIPLKRLDKTGTIVQTISNFKVLKLRSIF